jgi:hypothetical protein
MLIIIIMNTWHLHHKYQVYMFSFTFQQGRTKGEINFKSLVCQISLFVNSLSWYSCDVVHLVLQVLIRFLMQVNASSRYLAPWMCA